MFIKVHTHFWQLDNSSIHIYQSFQQLENKIIELNIDAIKQTLYENPNVQYRKNFLKTKPNYICKFHLVTEKHEYHCGIVTDHEKQFSILETASDFYNMFKLVQSSCSRSGI
jgi:hypothetical protein